MSMASEENSGFFRSGPGSISLKPGLLRYLLPSLGASIHLRVVSVIASAKISDIGLRLHSGLGLPIARLRILTLIAAISVVGAVAGRRIRGRIGVWLGVVRRGEKRSGNRRAQ